MPPRASTPAAIMPTAKPAQGQRKAKPDSTNAPAQTATATTTLRKKNASTTDLTAAAKGPRPNKGEKDSTKPKRMRNRSDKKPSGNPTEYIMSAPNKVKSKLSAAVASMTAAAAGQTVSASSKASSKQPRGKSSTAPRNNNNGAAPTTPQRKSRRSPAAVTPSSAGPITILQRHSEVTASTPSNAMLIRQQQPPRAAPISSSPPSKPTRDHAYAGPTFSNSPAASRLPMPDILLGGNSSNGVTLAVAPSLSPASSTTSLPQYTGGYSAPPSPTRAISGADLFACSNNSEYSSSMPAAPLSSSSSDSMSSFDSTEALRKRSRELLDMLCGSQTNYPYGQSSVSASSSAYSLSAARLTPPPVAYPCDPFYAGQPNSVLVAPPHAQEPYPFQQQQQQQQRHLVMPSAVAVPSTGEKMLINEMYSSNLRALLKIDVRA